MMNDRERILIMEAKALNRLGTLAARHGERHAHQIENGR